MIILQIKPQESEELEMLDGVMITINAIMFALLFFTGIAQVVPKRNKDFASALVLWAIGVVFMANVGYVIFS